MKYDEYITADTHFGHANMIKYSKRPFVSVEQMDAELIMRWNNKVPENAVVYHLGDFSFHKPEKTHRILNQLHGRIRLIKGNHDKVLRHKAIQDRFEWVKEYYESTTDDNIKVIMCHYAFEVWNKSHYGSYCLHGHSHNSLNNRGKLRMDVGVDANPNYEPFSFGEVKKYMNEPNRKINVVDHHNRTKK